VIETKICIWVSHRTLAKHTNLSLTAERIRFQGNDRW